MELRFPLTTVAVLFVEQAQAASGPALKQTEYMKVCRVATALRKIPGLARLQTEEKLEAAREAKLAALRMRVAALAGKDSNTTLVYSAMASVISAYSSDLLSEAASTADRAITAAATTAAAAGRIAEFFELLGKAAKGGAGTGHCLAASDGSNPATADGKSGCEWDSCEFAKAGYDFSESVFDQGGFKGINGNDAADSKAANRCILTQKPQAGANAGDFFQSNAVVEVAAGLIKITPANGAGRVALTPGANSIATNWKVTSPTTTVHIIYNAATELKDFTSPAYGTTEKEIIEKASEPARLTPQLSRFFSKKDNKESDGAAAKLAEAITKSVIAANGDGLDKLYQKIQSTDTVKKEEKGLKATNLSARTTTEDLLTALDYHTSEMQDKRDDAAKEIATLQSKLSEKTGTTDLRKVEEECNKHQSSDKCTEPCKWNDNATDKTKRCSLDPKKAAEQQATQAGKDEDQATTTKKCKGKDEKTCGSTQGCKWEGTECKDSSIIANKQLALMVSAAVAALLF
uniref:Variant surface glycoprotein 394 n=1 Tax=Trypanosoma brucei TaxID=5691 RepID=M4SZZ1_9TRYP|nr:variant surface glycoprotein 394 [Trypanosoma brucei]